MKNYIFLPSLYYFTLSLGVIVASGFMLTTNSIDQTFAQDNNEEELKNVVDINLSTQKENVIKIREVKEPFTTSEEKKTNSEQ